MWWDFEHYNFDAFLVFKFYYSVSCSSTIFAEVFYYCIGNLGKLPDYTDGLSPSEDPC